MKMKCFVASAFGFDDVDNIYINAICPVLAEFSIKPIRVDKDEHNDDIDDRMFERMAQAQICIADLTYARPSVYYEAGFVFGSKKPVIYVARSDHFRARDSDPQGNLRVHFDLQMKNIIPWTDSIENFKKRLRSRLRHVLKPLLRDQRQIEALEQARTRFNSMPQNERLKELLKEALGLLHKHGYRPGEFPKTGDIGGIYLPHFAQYHRAHDKTWQQVYVVVSPSIDRKILRLAPILPAFDFGRRKEDPNASMQIESLVVFVGLRSVKTATLVAALGDWNPVDSHIFEQKGGIVEREVQGLKVKVSQAMCRVVVIDSAKSIPEFSERFSSAIQATNKA